MATGQQIDDLGDRHVGSIFFRRAGELGDRTFIKLQRGAACEEISWRAFATNVHDAILGLHALGLKRGDRVAIIGENSLEWLRADMATLSGGFPNVAMAATLSDTMTLKMLRHSGCRAAFVANASAIGKLLNLKGQLPRLSHIIVMDGTGAGLPYTLTMGEFLARGATSASRSVDEIMQSIHPQDLATIMYTSGSTGEPKGVMRTHENLLSNITNGGEIVVSKPEELTALVLTVNHLVGRFAFLKSAVTGRTMAIVEANELLVDVKAIEALSPTAMTIVPRVMLKIWQAILNEGDNATLWEQLASLDLVRAEQGLLGPADDTRFRELRKTLQEAVKRALGGRMKYISYTGAPMPPRILRFFELVGIPLLGTYGSTECGGVTLSGIGENKPGSAGKPFANVQVRIADDGEILVRGPTITPGYFENPEATREAFDEEGWFHTGDLGRMDADGCLYVVGRKKDVFYCPDGSNIYPGFIELLLESEPFVRQAILLGDHRPFFAALLVPDRSKIGAELKKPESTLTDGEVRALLQARVDKINARLEEVEQIRKFVVLAADFPTEVRSLTAIQKVKIDRKAVEERYKQEISEIYTPAAEGRGG